MYNNLPITTSGDNIIAKVEDSYMRPSHFSFTYRMGGKITYLHGVFYITRFKKMCNHGQKFRFSLGIRKAKVKDGGTWRVSFKRGLVMKLENMYSGEKISIPTTTKNVHLKNGDRLDVKITMIEEEM